MRLLLRAISDNYKLTCKVKGVPNDTGKAVHYNANNNPMGADTPCFIDVPPFPG